jgi:small conductance mechanosensitive channel
MIDPGKVMKSIFVRLWETHSEYILILGSRFFTAAIIIIAGIILVKTSGRILRRAAAGRLKLDETVGSMLRLVIRYGVIIICMILILNIFGINTASLIALLGAAGVAIGLALKDTLSNIASGIILLLLRTYRKGDFIECGSVVGTVKDMDLFSTTLETGDGILIFVPNSILWGVPLKNYSRSKKRRMDLSIGISYNDSIDTAFAVMLQIAADEKRFLRNPPPQVMVQSLGDSSVNIMLRAWAAADVYWSTYWEQMRNIKEKIEAAGLTIPFPQRDIHIV